MLQLSLVMLQLLNTFVMFSTSHGKVTTVFLPCMAWYQKWV